MELTLTTEEWELLSEILSERHRALLREIAHTDHREFKLALLERERLLESLVNRLRLLQPELEPMSNIRR
jgi:hypothetical protein